MKRTGNALQLLFVAGLLFFLARYVWLQWQAVERTSGPDATWFAGGTVLALGAMLITVAGYRAIIQGHGVRIAYSHTVAVFFLPLLGKYIPGKIWSVVAAVQMYHHMGISRKIAAACITLFMALGLAAGVLVSLAVGPSLGGPSTSIVSAVLLGPILAIILCPRAFYGGLNWTLTIARREPITTRLSSARLFGVLAIFAAERITYGLGFCLVVMSVERVALSAWPGLIALFTFAQIAGIMALFAPAGIGVREGVLLVGLGPIVGPGPAIVVTGVTRLWQTALELLMAGVGWWAMRSSNDKASSNDARSRMPQDEYPPLSREHADVTPAHLAGSDASNARAQQV
jgi:hypothetical protein